MTAADDESGDLFDDLADELDEADTDGDSELGHLPAGDGLTRYRRATPPNALTFVLAGGCMTIVILFVIGGLMRVFSGEQVVTIAALFVGPCSVGIAWHYFGIRWGRGQR